jgi:hypothetical protein
MLSVLIVLVRMMPQKYGGDADQGTLSLLTIAKIKQTLF